MESIISNSINELQSTINLLEELKNTKESINEMNNIDKLNIDKKFICFSKNIELIKDNVICLLSDIKSNKSTLSKETLELIADNDEVCIVIKELLPYLLYYYFNRKN